MKKDLVISASWAIGIVAVALISSYARNIGMMDHETVQRVVLCATGLMIAAFGNRMPKAFAPTAIAQQVNRVGGWSLAISGLMYAGLWALAPFQVALIAGCAAIIVGMAVTVGYCLRMRARWVEKN